MYLTKEETGKWSVRLYYKDFTGKRKQKHKSGFATRKEAKLWGESFIAQQDQKIDMTFGDFYQVYRKDMSQRLRENTFRTKDYIVELKILPYFGKKKMTEITTADIRRWQTEMIKQDFSPTYLHTIDAQLKAIFNYAVRYYGLTKSPCDAAGNMGKGKADEMQFWIKEEFDAFIPYLKDKPQAYYAFLTLFWTGMRIGELLALNVADFNVEDRTISVTKSYQRIAGRDVITEPKTEKSKRIITLPEFLVEELKDYQDMLYGIMPDDRLFPITKSFLEKEMVRGCKLSGVKKIRLHDLRHSHASLLISGLGMEVGLVSARLGHEDITTTLRTYSHLYPTQHRELADQLDTLVSTEVADSTEEV